jgi:hypothetical protein
MIIILYMFVPFLKKIMLVVRGIQNCEFSGPWGRLATAVIVHAVPLDATLSVMF